MSHAGPISDGWRVWNAVTTSPQRAGVVPTGTLSGERMPKARHTAGQRVLDRTGNLKAVQRLLGHTSMQTTGDVYADWDFDELAAALADVLQRDES